MQVSVHKKGWMNEEGIFLFLFNYLSIEKLYGAEISQNCDIIHIIFLSTWALNDTSDIDQIDLIAVRFKKVVFAVGLIKVVSLFFFHRNKRLDSEKSPIHATSESTFGLGFISWSFDPRCQGPPCETKC